MDFLVITLLLILIAEVYLVTREKKQRIIKPMSTLVDTSVLIDGRVIDLAKTGFLRGQIIVPKSVLAELQLLADGSDHGKRERARFGLDVVKKLKELLGSSFVLLQDGQASSGVDDQLINLAKETDSALLTLDFNLNKVAQVEGINVLNINELAKSLRMTQLPGDVINLALIQKGQSSDQAVGYLPDGTMVVVEQAKKFIGQTKQLEIIRSLQTDAGKMMFAKLTQSNQDTNRQHNEKRPIIGRRKNVKSDQPNNSTKRDYQSVRSKSGTTVKRAKSNKKTSAQREDELIRLVENQN